MDEVRDAESLVYTYRKDMKDMETQLRQQQNLYAAVRNDRTGLAKSLTESQDEIADLKGKLRVLSHQFDQLKEEVEAKEASLVKASQDQFQLQKEKDEVVGQMDIVKSEVKQMKKTRAETERSHQVSYLSFYVTGQTRLHNTLADGERAIEIDTRRSWKDEKVAGKSFERQNSTGPKIGQKSGGVDAIHQESVCAGKGSRQRRIPVQGQF